MEIACNYYNELIELINDNFINIDLIKFPSLGFQFEIFADGTLDRYEEWITKTNKIKPVMIHGVGPTCSDIGKKTFQKELNKDLARRVISLSGLNGVSLHFAGIDTSLSNLENKRILKDNINYLKEVFNDAEFLEFENVDGNPFKNKNKFGICIQPDFISEVIYETDVKFLLDISHAYISAKCLGMDFYDYLNRLPLDRLYEIHLNGWFDSGTDIMAHLKITEEGYETLNYILKSYKPEIVTIEYGRDYDRMNMDFPLLTSQGGNDHAKEEIIEQVDRIREIVNEYK